MSKSDKAAMLLFAFIPWILVLVFKPMIVPHNGFSAFQQTMFFVGSMWIVVSPCVFLLGWKIFQIAVDEKRR